MEVFVFVPLYRARSTSQSQQRDSYCSDLLLNCGQLPLVSSNNAGGGPYEEQRGMLVG